MNKSSFIVSNTEVSALKEVIFKRARERSQALVDGVQNDYTQSVQSDIMDLARASFVSQKNPFAFVKEKEEKFDKVEITEKTEEEPVVEESKNREIGFAQRNLAEIKSQINYRNRVNTENIVNNQREAVMAEAGDGFVKKASFMGALDFLNSQASISLIKNKGKSFEAIA